MRKRKCACCGDVTDNYVIINKEEVYVCENGHVFNEAKFVPVLVMRDDIVEKKMIAHCDICGTELRPLDFIMNAWVHAGCEGKPICADCYFK